MGTPLHPAVGEAGVFDAPYGDAGGLDALAANKDVAHAVALRPWGP